VLTAQYADTGANGSVETVVLGFSETVSYGNVTLVRNAFTFGPGT